MMKRLEKKHPLAIRWFHWINFPILALMVWSGLLIYWANPVYRIGIGSHTLLKMTVAEKTYEKLHVAYRLAEGISFHFFVMWFFAINGVLYVLYTLISSEWRFLVPNRHSFAEAVQVLLHDLHLRREAPPPRKFNGAQQIAYTAIILMGLGSLLTGLAIWRPIQFGWLTALFGGYQAARFFHFWITIGYVVFFVVHVAQVVKTGWNNFRAMVIGVEVVND
ncbi:MAG TPA: cytochrome b/b6 domain-containing protein [Thermoanaerobaculia bacterium]|jgi:thiosulfate reductase cytochrome b subunit|nr:cytochrome b/b6 domain-containing protein [Thermoanaerobaculia bacterium]